ncbi:MAG: hypothetical protein M1837_004641 [Sclerophora amabilis]|nr:MAG: hypothetical protein M1837_004641 [Sclerophora amabilis]
MSPPPPDDRADSIGSQSAGGGGGGGEKKAKNRRPANTAFRQQRLKAWQPILTPKTVLPLFFAVGIIFAPIGGLLLWASAQVQELVINYSDCSTEAPLGDGVDAFVDMPPDKITSTFKSTNSSNLVQAQYKRNFTSINYAPGVDVNTSVCSLSFRIPDEIGPPVYLFYRLSNFYQNHRRYVKSLDDSQLKGDAVSNVTIDGGSCAPLKLNETGFAYYPCGLIANSVFNDTFMEPVVLGDSSNKTYPMTDKGIAWASDATLYGPTKYRWDEVAPPPNWMLRYPNGYTPDNPPPELHKDESLQVWMRTAGLPTFSKLARRNDDQKMEGGNYRIDIRDSFPVIKYGGTKSIVLSTRTVMGGRNPFLGIAYVVVGGLKLGDHTYLSWNNDQPSTATTSGRDMRGGTGSVAA